MRKLLAVLPILMFLLCATPAHATWTMIQHPATSCSSATTCTVTLSATGSGNLLVIGMAVYQPTLQPTLVSISAGGSFVEAPNCAAFTSSHSGTDCGYVLSSTGGVTSIIVTYLHGNAGGGDTYIEIVEYHSSLGAGVYDTSNSITHGTTVANPAGVALTLSGSNDVLFQLSAYDNGGASAISGSYTNPADFRNGGFMSYAGWLNTADGTAPTWTASSSQPTLGAEAFKEAGAVAVSHAPPMMN